MKKWFVFVFAIILWVSEAQAQGTVYATSGMGRNSAGTARLQAQLAVEKDQREKANVCGNAGQLYGPNHAAADADGCIGALTIDVDGDVAASGAINSASLTTTGAATLDSLSVSNNTIIGAVLDVTGPTTLTGRVELGNGIRLSEAASCDATGVLRYVAAKEEVQVCNGSEWLPIGTGAGAATCDFNFAEIINADVDTFYNTADAVYSGLSAVASVAGNAPNATIRKNASDTGFSSGVSINSSDLVGIRAKSSPNFNRIVTATMDVGDNFTACWSITTKEQDVVPNAFAFSSQENVTRDSIVISNEVTITGIEGEVGVSVSGEGAPQLSVNGGSWRSGDSVISDGQTLRLRMTAASGYEETRMASVSVGTETQSWSVTTEIENQPSCKEWLDKGFSTSGVYVIDPDGSGGSSPYDVYCDMVEDGGGWTLVATVSAGGGNSWMSSAAWTSNTTFGSPTSTSLSSDMKNRAFSEVSFTQFRIRASSSARRVTNVAGAAFSNFATMMGAGYIDHGGVKYGSWHSQPYFERYFTAITELPGATYGVTRDSYGYCVIAANFDFCPECGYDIGGGWGCYGGSCQRGACGDVVRETSINIYVR
ncbi:MAG: fibrinogen-like YCDxxxxGGGW domain-containing protein [Alphaproteobacteria bacterium]